MARIWIFLASFIVSFDSYNIKTIFNLFFSILAICCKHLKNCKMRIIRKMRVIIGQSPEMGSRFCRIIKPITDGALGSRYWSCTLVYINSHFEGAQSLNVLLIYSFTE